MHLIHINPCSNSIRLIIFDLSRDTFNHHKHCHCPHSFSQLRKSVHGKSVLIGYGLLSGKNVKRTICKYFQLVYDLLCCLISIVMLKNIISHHRNCRGFRTVSCPSFIFSLLKIFLIHMTDCLINHSDMSAGKRHRFQCLLTDCISKLCFFCHKAVNVRHNIRYMKRIDIKDIFRRLCQIDILTAPRRSNVFVFSHWIYHDNVIL